MIHSFTTENNMATSPLQKKKKGKINCHMIQYPTCEYKPDTGTLVLTTILK